MKSTYFCLWLVVKLNLVNKKGREGMDGDDKIIQDQVEDKQDIPDIESDQENAILSKELQKAEKIKMSKTKKIILICTSLLLLAAIGAGGLYYRNTTTAAKNETRGLDKCKAYDRYWSSLSGYKCRTYNSF